jgi:hypothetical protein
VWLKRCARCGEAKPLDQFRYNENTGRFSMNCVDHVRRKLWEYSSPRSYLMTKLALIHRRDKDVEINLSHLLDMYENCGGLCSVTGIPMTHSPDTPETNISVDRKDCEIGYVPGNIRLVCAAVNSMRGRMDDRGLLWWSEAVVRGMSFGRTRDH